MTTAGARHLAESSQWLAAQRTQRGDESATHQHRKSSAASQTAPLFEVAAAHDGQPADAWLKMLYRVMGLKA